MRRTSFNEGWIFRSKGRHSLSVGVTSAPGWAPVSLPHDAMIGTSRTPSAHAATAYYQGGVWEYRKVFRLAGEELRQTLLEFEGVYRDALVWVNGTLAARRPFGYSRFLVPIGQFLQPHGDNEVRVEVRAGRDSRWYSGAGIYRNVWLLTGPEVHLAPHTLKVRNTHVDRDGATIEVSAYVENDSSSVSPLFLGVEVRDAKGSLVAADKAPLTTFAGDRLVTRRRLFLPEPQRWSPDNPYLYRCRVALLDGPDLVDEDSTAFGVRTLSVDPVRGLRINDEPLLLRGACVHHDNGVIGSATIDRAEERRVEILKAAGFNAIRSAHNPMSKVMLDACDRIGLVVMDEAFDMWLEPKSPDDFALRFEDWWEAEIESMVAKDFNHPSVVFYSIGNEIPEGSTRSGIHIGRAIAEKVRQLDDTRLVTQAVNGLLVGGAELLAETEEEKAARSPGGDDDIAGDNDVNTALVQVFGALTQTMTSDLVTDGMAEAVSYLDVTGYNYMESRLVGDRLRFPHQVIVASETFPASADTGWAAVTDLPHVIGDFTWTGWDYLGEAGMARTVLAGEGYPSDAKRFLGGYPHRAAGCGDMDITGQRRPQSFYRQIVFGLRSEPYIAVKLPGHTDRKVLYSSPWSWDDVVSTWTWECEEGTEMTVQVYSPGDEVELLLDGCSLGRRPVGRANRFRTEFSTPYARGELVAIAYQGETEIGRASLRSAIGCPKLRARADRSRVRADSTDLSFVSIELVDEAGTLVPTSDRRVSVSIDGPGALQGIGSADPSSEEPFVASSCTTFRGRALAVVRPTGTGVIQVSVSTDDCESQMVRIRSRPAE